MWRGLVAIGCAIAAAVGGYFVGHSGGVNVSKARAAGEQAGRARAATDRRAYPDGVAEGRKAGYREAYRPAFEAARQKARGAGK
jgi:hypothetical protein